MWFGRGKIFPFARGLCPRNPPKSGTRHKNAEDKFGEIIDEKPVRLTVALPGGVHRDLAAYAEALSSESCQPTEPAKLIAPTLARFMATDRAFVLGRK
jgi:hypothetical protein